jgi:predicted nucleic acid-binding protein
MTVVVDINILLDVFLSRKTFLAESQTILNEVVAGSLRGICPSHGLTTLFYLLEKHASTTEAETAVDKILAHFEIHGLNTSDWTKVRQLTFSDFEDAAVAYTASERGASFIVTRNIADFKSSPVPAISPSEFILRFLPPP